MSLILIDIHVQGTWQFISAQLLLNFGEEHLLRDDLESVLHVTSWVPLRYCAHNLNAMDLSRLLINVFDAGYITPDGVSVGGREKKYAILSLRIAIDVQFTNNPELQSLIMDLTKLISVRYEPPPTEEGYWQRDIIATATFSSPEDAAKALEKTMVVQYEKRMKELNTSDRVLEIFDRHLQDPDKWPKNDAAKANEVLDDYAC